MVDVCSYSGIFPLLSLTVHSLVLYYWRFRAVARWLCQCDASCCSRWLSGDHLIHQIAKRCVYFYDGNLGVLVGFRSLDHFRSHPIKFVFSCVIYTQIRSSNQSFFENVQFVVLTELLKRD